MIDGNSQIKLTKKLLRELEDVALSCPYDFINFDYRETQQLLTLYSMEVLLNQFNISCPYTTKEILNEKRSDRIEEED